MHQSMLIMHDGNIYNNVHFEINFQRPRTVGLAIRTRDTNTWTRTWTRTRNLLDSDSDSRPEQLDSDSTRDMQDSDSTRTRQKVDSLHLCL
jgi:hypothetical protein